MNQTARDGFSRLTQHDIYLFKQGTHFRLADKLGAHLVTVEGTPGAQFAVWAPNARQVSVIGDFNGWDAASHPLRSRPDGSGIWEGFVPGVVKGACYKYHIASSHRGYRADKGDPFALRWETPPHTASMVWDLGYDWGDQQWMSNRYKPNALWAPWSIYEVHLGSWRRVPEEGARALTYRELAQQLADYCHHMGFTHVELLPVMEHPFYGSWGYQTVGYFAPTARYGTPQDFMYFVDHLHRHGIGVILDWVPSHFPDDAHGLSYFDGTYLFEHADPKKGFHPDWNSYIFNYGRHEVRAFLTSSALFWLDKYHVDGLRVDAVASMLYLDYARKPGEWIPNRYGGNENIEAIDFLKRLNEAAYGAHPDIQTVAEESTAWPMVSRPTHLGGLGFGMKWNMGWMHDTLAYFARDPIHRKHHQNQLTFGIWYAFHENFVLPLSHDEVVYGKGSLLGRMPGDKAMGDKAMGDNGTGDNSLGDNGRGDGGQRFANLRALFGYMYGHPGKKLLFMGGELGQWREWSHEESLDWHLLEYPSHQGIQRWVRDLNHLYRAEPALHAQDFAPEGFEWVDFQDWEKSILSFLRKGGQAGDIILVVCNFTPVLRTNYHVGVPRGGLWKELLNSDAPVYGGQGYGNLGGVETAPIGAHGRYHSVSLTLPPLSVIFFKSAGGPDR